VLLIDEDRPGPTRFRGVCSRSVGLRGEVAQLGTFRARRNSASRHHLEKKPGTVPCTDALKRRWLYHGVEHPNIRARRSHRQVRAARGARSAAERVAALVGAAAMGLESHRVVDETIDGPSAQTPLGRVEARTRRTVGLTLGSVIKERARTAGGSARREWPTWCRAAVTRGALAAGGTTLRCLTDPRRRTASAVAFAMYCGGRGPWRGRALGGQLPPQALGAVGVRAAAPPSTWRVRATLRHPAEDLSRYDEAFADFWWVTGAHRLRRPRSFPMTARDRTREEDAAPAPTGGGPQSPGATVTVRYSPAERVLAKRDFDDCSPAEMDEARG